MIKQYSKFLHNERNTKNMESRSYSAGGREKGKLTK